MMAASAWAVMVASSARVLVAQEKNPYRHYTEQKFVENMQAAGRNYAAVMDLLAKADYDSAKAQLTRAREQLAVTVTFWKDRQLGNAVTLLRQTLDSTDMLDAALSEDPVEGAAVTAAAQRLNASCRSCHDVYRSQDPVTKAYHLKLPPTP
jgi:cytochrome c556